MTATAKTLPWKDAPSGNHWSCPDCSHATESGMIAGEHVLCTGHALPASRPNSLDVMLELRRNRSTSKKPMLAVRAGDYVQAGYDLRLALEIASVAIGEAESAGAPASTINKLRAMVKQLRG